MELLSNVWLFFGVINALIILYAIVVINDRSNLRAVRNFELLNILTGMAIWSIMILLGFVGGPFWTIVSAPVVQKFKAARRRDRGVTIINQ